MANIIDFSQHFSKRGDIVMKKVSIFDVAKYFLSLADNEAESFITPLKLQKLMYYAQAWSLVWDGQPLFDDEFEAWAHGPANPELYQQYKRHGWLPIPCEGDYDCSLFSEDQLDTMNIVWDAYGKYDAKYLESLTHREAPWLDARGECGPGERCSNLISKESMKNYYYSLLDEEEE